MTKQQNSQIGSGLASTGGLLLLLSFLGRTRFPNGSRVLEAVGTSTLASSITFFALAEVSSEESVILHSEDEDPLT